MKYLFISLLACMVMGCTTETTLPDGHYVCFTESSWRVMIALLMVVIGALGYLLGAVMGYKNGKKQKPE